MSYPPRKVEEAKRLRYRGYSIKEISKKLNIAQSTTSSWLRDVSLNKKARNRLEQRKILGYLKAIETRKLLRGKIKDDFDNKAKKQLLNLKVNISVYKLLCSFLFWTEGGKSTDSYVYFINSEPKMVKTFLQLMRHSFTLDETKLRCLVHIHDYHNEQEIKNYWSRVTKIPLDQFSKSYNKPNTKKRIRKNYKGSIRIRYYDYKIALELRSFYNMFVQDYLGV